ncbi:hypothetical protein V8F06_008871 [Rhypophila decipiens]
METIFEYQATLATRGVLQHIGNMTLPWAYAFRYGPRPGSRRPLSRHHIHLIVALIALAVLILTYLWYSILALAHSKPLRLLGQRSGNQVAAADVYGLGVRVGLYTQTIGMLIAAASFHTGGIKLAGSAIMIAYLACWTQLARAGEFSPCEAWLIGTLVGTTAVSGQVVSLIPDSSIVGTFLLLVASVWALATNIWFWSTLYARLPPLGTRGVVWFFTEVQINGWFRVFMLVLLSIGALFLIAGTTGAVIAMRKSMEHGVREVTEEQLMEEIEEWKVGVWVSAVGGLVTLIFTIASAEMIIRYNALQPERSLSTPGQAIPFAIGIITLVDGIISFLIMLLNDELD